MRDGQNVIREGGSGNIIYMPPESKDVPHLMEDMVDWINIQLNHAELTTPIIAALAHYQFATIHPYFDGNGITARPTALNPHPITQATELCGGDLLTKRTQL